MALTTLKDDLLAEFRDERIMINEQIDILEPLAISLRKPAAIRLLSSGTFLITEYICYIISLAGIVFMVYMNKVKPLSILNELFYNTQYRRDFGAENLLYLLLIVYGLMGISAIFVFIIGRMAREMRLKNDILNLAGKDIKTIVGQHLERKATLENIEQRHMLGLSGVSQQVRTVDDVNTTANPGYGE